MHSVERAMAQGWEVVLPVERMTHDYRVILMRHKRTDGRLELGFALEVESESELIS